MIHPKSYDSESNRRTTGTDVSLRREISSNPIGESVHSIPDAVIRYSCDESNCHIARSEFELIDYDTLSN